LLRSRELPRELFRIRAAKQAPVASGGVLTLIVRY
jgi:hypothetical protein